MRTQHGDDDDSDDDVDEQPRIRRNRITVSGTDRGSQEATRPIVSFSNPNTPDNQVSVSRQRTSKKQGYSPAMASEAIFHMFPEPGEQQQEHDVNAVNENDRFIQKQYPMLYMNLSAHEHPSIVEVQCDKDTGCLLCELDKNTLDSIKVLKPHEVKGYLDSYNHKFTEEQVNIHLAHTVKDENAIEVIQNMSVDLLSRSYSLANDASLCILHRIRTHMGRPFLIPDQDVAKVHNDAVKQFIGLASTWQTLMKYKQNNEKGGGPVTNPLL